MDIQRINLENADIVAATGVTAGTIQTWANRGILALSEEQRNPGPGQRRLYSRLDLARIAVINTLIDFGLSASVAGQIAARLERSPQTAAGWRSAIEQMATHIHLFTDGKDAVGIYVGNDKAELARRFIETNESDLAGTIGRGVQQLIPTQMNAAVFDVGPAVSKALREVAARRYHLWFTNSPNNEGPVSMQVTAIPTAGSSGKHWQGTFAIDELLSAVAQTLALPAPVLGSLRGEFSSGRKTQFGVSVTEEMLIAMGLTEKP